MNRLTVGAIIDEAFEYNAIPLKHPDDHRAILTHLNEAGETVQSLVCTLKDCPEHPSKD